MNYQEKAATFAKYGDITYPFLALSEEVGEVNGKIAKAVRKSGGKTPSDILYELNMAVTEEQITLRRDIIIELGDVQWQLAACCTELGITLEDIEN